MRLSIVMALACGLQAQAPPSAPKAGEPAIFQEGVTLVTVPAVVRDRQGRTVGTLKAEDFELLDRGKPQTISRFTIETSVQAGTDSDEPAEGGALARKKLAPLRFIAYLFDDLNSDRRDLLRVREAAGAHIRESLQAGDRAAIYTTSGRIASDFTDDRGALQRILDQVQPRPVTDRRTEDCPRMTYYLADLIHNHSEPVALRAAIAEAAACAGVGRSAAESLARAAALREVAQGRQDVRASLGVLSAVVRRMATAPGQRIVLLASSGFVTPEDHHAKNAITERALQARVTVHTLDAGGVRVDSAMDAGRRGLDVRQRWQLEQQTWSANADVMAELAEGTGGTFFHGNNSLTLGFRKLAEVPERLYLLGFSPRDLQMDGSFHPLKLRVKGRGLTVTARRGYYAPKSTDGPEETATAQIEEAIFARDELRGIPATLKAEWKKLDGGPPQLVLITRVALKMLRYRIEAGRRRNSLAVLYAIFDANGRCVATQRARFDLNVLEQTLAGPDPGVTARRSFEVKPGSYRVRVVIRDSEEQRMTALDATVDAPAAERR